MDRDGTVDERDNCRIVANATQADYDQDGIGDECDSEQGINAETGYGREFATHRSEQVLLQKVS